MNGAAGHCLMFAEEPRWLSSAPPLSRLAAYARLAAMTGLDVTLVAHEVGTLGGMESQLGILAQGLLDAGVRVTIVTRRCEVAPQSGLRVHRVRTPRRPFPLGYPLFAIAASVVIRRHRRGVMHVTGAIVPLAADCVTVHFCHAAYRQLGLGPRPGGPGGFRQLSALTSRQMAVLFERWCFTRRRARRMIAVSPGVRDELTEHFPAMSDRIEVISHGVDGAKFAPDREARERIRAKHNLAEQDRVAVFVGGDWKRKRLAHALQAVARTDDWKLLVVGRGHVQDYAQSAADLGIPDRVRFAGVSDDVPAHLAAGDVFLLPTEYETFCMVAFEAAACGLPVLVTPVSGPDLLVKPGVNGELLDDDASRTAGLLRLYSDQNIRRTRGAAAREAALGFSWEQANAAHIAVYRQLANLPAQRP